MFFHSFQTWSTKFFFFLVHLIALNHQNDNNIVKHQISFILFSIFYWIYLFFATGRWEPWIDFKRSASFSFCLLACRRVHERRFARWNTKIWHCRMENGSCRDATRTCEAIKVPNFLVVYSFHLHNHLYKIVYKK